MRSRALRSRTIPASRRKEEWCSQGHTSIGARVVRVFHGVSYSGRVVKWLQADEADSALFHVVHEDGDEEDLEEGELGEAIAAEATAKERRQQQQATGPRGLSDYELERLANIKENNETLNALGLQTLTPPKVRPRTTVPRRPSQPRFAEAPSRASPRLASQPTKSYNEAGIETESRGAKRALMIMPSVPALAPGTELDLPAPKRGKWREREVEAAEELSEPAVAVTEEERVALVENGRARYKELFQHFKVVTNGGRADLKTLKQMGYEGSMVNADLRGVTGDLPGLEVGCEFHNKCEMQVLGMHRKWLSGIDYVSTAAAEDGVSYATAVVSSGGYEDDEDDGDELWYTGEGGNDLLSSRRQTAAQRLTKGNLALVGNLEKGLPVRLVRFVGQCEEERSFTNRLYTEHAPRVGRLGGGSGAVQSPLELGLKPSRDGQGFKIRFSCRFPLRAGDVWPLWQVHVRRPVRRDGVQVRGGPTVQARLQVLAATPRGPATAA